MNKSPIFFLFIEFNWSRRKWKHKTEKGKITAHIHPFMLEAHLSKILIMKGIYFNTPGQTLTWFDSSLALFFASPFSFLIMMMMMMLSLQWCWIRFSQEFCFQFHSKLQRPPHHMEQQSVGNDRTQHSSCVITNHSCRHNSCCSSNASLLYYYGE